MQEFIQKHLMYGNECLIIAIHKINDKIRFVKLVTTSIFLNFVDRWKIEVIASGL